MVIMIKIALVVQKLNKDFLIILNVIVWKDITILIIIFVHYVIHQ